MKTLGEAWRWYRGTKTLLEHMRRLGERHWEQLPWDGELGRDDRFKDVLAVELVETADYSLSHLDDLAVVVLFSVFEAVVREIAFEGVEDQLARLRHPIVESVVRESIEKIKKGDFHQVLDLYKILNSDLVEQVHQVRKYRNWVAHGKGSEAPPIVGPQAAYGRLNAFLLMIDPDAESNDPPPEPDEPDS